MRKNGKNSLALQLSADCGNGNDLFFGHMKIGKGQLQQPILFRCRSGNFGQRIVPLHGIAMIDNRPLPTALMTLEQLKYMIGGGLHQVIPCGQIQGMQIIAKLGHIGHIHNIAAVIKNIQRQRGNDGVSQGALLLVKIVSLAGA